MIRGVVLLLVLGAFPATGQEPSVVTRSNLDFARQAWREVRSNLFQAAVETPDSLFAFRPTPEVRSFLEMLDHVAASEAGYCHMALGERPTGGGSGTGATTKVGVLEALDTAFEVCERAYGQADSLAALPAFGSRRTTRLQVLLTNAMHDGEHYGNVVTYLRLNGIAPPSSRASPP